MGAGPRGGRRAALSPRSWLLRAAGLPRGRTSPARACARTWRREGDAEAPGQAEMRWGLNGPLQPGHSPAGRRAQARPVLRRDGWDPPSSAGLNSVLRWVKRFPLRAGSSQPKLRGQPPSPERSRTGTAGAGALMETLARRHP